MSEHILLQLYDRFHLTPRLLAAFGEQRDRFKGADELQKYSGIAPVTERSGKKCWVHWRWQCPTFLRQTFVEWAGQTINPLFIANQLVKTHTPRATECRPIPAWRRALRSCHRFLTSSGNWRWLVTAI